MPSPSTEGAFHLIAIDDSLFPASDKYVGLENGAVLNVAEVGLGGLVPT